MPRLPRAAVLLAALLFAGSVAIVGVGNVGAQEDVSAGLAFCQDTPAWPYGPYLGQMHPDIVEQYRLIANLTGSDPCRMWTADYRSAAISGLRQAGYTIIKPTVPPDIRRYFDDDPAELFDDPACTFDDWRGSGYFFTRGECYFDGAQYELYVTSIVREWTDDTYCLEWQEGRYPQDGTFFLELGTFCYAR